MIGMKLAPVATAFARAALRLPWRLLLYSPRDRDSHAGETCRERKRIRSRVDPRMMIVVMSCARRGTARSSG